MYTKDALGYKKRVRKKSKRPVELSVICALIVLFGFINIISMYIGEYAGIHTIYPAVNALIIVFSFVSVSGVWSMEKWGPITFPVVVLLKIITDAVFGEFSAWYLLGFIIAFYFFRFYPNMKHSE
jgi:hypothetical protein